MKVSYGASNNLEQSIVDVLGKTTATIAEVIEHYAGVFLFDNQQVDAVINGAVAGPDLTVDDNSVIVLTPKANTKG